MSVLTCPPSLVPPPSYSRTKIQPPPYKATEPSPKPVAVPQTTSFNPLATLKRILTSSSTEASTASIPLSTTKSNSSRTAPHSSPVPSDDQSVPSIPSPTYSPIAASKPPAYSASPSPTNSTVVTRSNTSNHQQAHGVAMDYSSDEWEREQRRRYEAMDAAQREREGQGCCAWWWSVGSDPLPWAGHFVY